VIDLVLTDPVCRAVAADYLQERGVYSPASWLERMGVTVGARVEGADADAYATVYVNAYADAHAADYACAHADAYTDADAYATADADADASVND